MIKEKTTGYCVIRNDHYGHSFKVISELVEEAKRDFPTLIDDGIEVVQFGGRHYARTYGIEFEINDKANSNLQKYRDIGSLEKTL